MCKLYESGVFDSNELARLQKIIVQSSLQSNLAQTLCYLECTVLIYPKLYNHIYPVNMKHISLPSKRLALKIQDPKSIMVLLSKTLQAVFWKTMVNVL